MAGACTTKESLRLGKKGQEPTILFTKKINMFARESADFSNP